MNYAHMISFKIDICRNTTGSSSELFPRSQRIRWFFTDHGLSSFWQKTGSLSVREVIIRKKKVVNSQLWSWPPAPPLKVVKPQFIEVRYIHILKGGCEHAYKHHYLANAVTRNTKAISSHFIVYKYLFIWKYSLSMSVSLPMCYER